MGLPRNVLDVVRAQIVKARTTAEPVDKELTQVHLPGKMGLWPDAVAGILLKHLKIKVVRGLHNEHARLLAEGWHSIWADRCSRDSPAHGNVRYNRSVTIRLIGAAKKRKGLFTETILAKKRPTIGIGRWKVEGGLRPEAKGQRYTKTKNWVPPNQQKNVSREAGIFFSGYRCLSRRPQSGFLVPP